MLWVIAKIRFKAAGGAPCCWWLNRRERQTQGFEKIHVWPIASIDGNITGSGFVRLFMFVKTLRLWCQDHRRKLSEFVLHRLLHADDSPHKLALGVAVGVFVAFTPTVGLQMVIAGFLSWLLGANKAVSLPMVWISNPATLIPLYWYCYRIGCAILALDPIGHEWWEQLAMPPVGWWAKAHFYWSRFLEIAGPVWLGGCVVGFVCAYASYSIVYRMICYYRKHRESIRKRRETPPDES